jgi:Tol biopolymer transport system component
MRQRLGKLFLGAVALLFALSVAVPAMAAASRFDSRIAFVLGPDVFSMNPDGSDVKQLTTVPAGMLAFSQSWSSDGQNIIYAVYPTDFSSGTIWEMNADGSNQRQIFNPPAGMLPGDVLSFSPDAKYIVMTLCAAQCAIYRIRADGTGLTALTHFDPNPDVTDLYTAYSPDGKTIAFTSVNRGGVKYAVYLMDADGKNIRLLTPPELEAVLPQWSPDGQRIVFEAHESFGGQDTHGFNEEIWTIGADGMGARQLTNNNHGLPIFLETPHDSVPSWSPEGDHIVFERDNGPFTVSSVYVIGADGSGERALTQPRPMTGRRGAAVSALARGRVTSRSGVHRIEVGGVFPRWSPEL